MSLERLTITLHCWPTRRPPRRAPSRTQRTSEDELPSRRFALADVALDGDDVRDVERFDVAVAEALLDAASRLARVPTHRLDDLRAIGYATRLEVHTTACGTLELIFPAELLAGCQRLGLCVQIANDHAVMIDRDEHAFVADDASDDLRNERSARDR